MILHPLFLAVYPVLALLEANWGQVDPGEAVRPLLLSLVLAGAIWGGSRLWVRAPGRSALVTSLALVLFVSYGHVYQAIEGRGIAGFDLGRHRYLVPLWLAAFAAGTWRILRMENPRPWNQALNAASFAAVALPTLGLLGNVVQPRSVAVVPPPPMTAGAVLPTRSPLPDVYFVLLDMYARADTLQVLYDYDNRPFLDDLENLGFEILDNSHSNYGQTSLSLAGTFQMRYLDDVFGTERPQGQDLGPLFALLADNPVMELFRSWGYRIVAFGSGYRGTELVGADLYWAPNASSLQAMDALGGLNAFEGMFLQTTAGILLTESIAFLPESLRPDLQTPFRAHRERILFALDRLDDLPEIPGPKFVFLHLVSPHPPFVFGPNGEEISHPEAYTLRQGVFQGSRQDYIQGYTDQLTYLNQRVLDALRTLLATSDPPPIVVLQGDHGSDASSVGTDPAPITYVQERMSILNALLLPGCSRDGLKEDLTSVNTFRLILRNCFGQPMTLLEDRSFLSAYTNPYAWDEVTGQID
ncbi:MAG: hypothetical protein WD906_02450 [Anaerolineales bacterium]